MLRLGDLANRLHCGPITIALTGGSCSGKSSLRHWLANELGQETSWEADALRFCIGHAGPTQSNPWTPQWQRDFQKESVPMQIKLEDRAKSFAIMSGQPTVWLDRGLPDQSAYWPVDCPISEDPRGYRYDQTDFYQWFGLDRSACLARYDLVIHLESLACGNLPSYRKFSDSNPGRFETPQEALQADRRIKQAWAGHPNLVIVGWNSSLLEKKQLLSRYLLPPTRYAA